MSHYHAVVWLDHAEARVFQFNREEAEKLSVHGHKHHLHHKAGQPGAGKQAIDTGFFDAIAASLDGSGEILVLGPGNAKLEFIRYAHRAKPQLEARIAGVETVDHPTDGQIVAYARKYFIAEDRMRPLLAQPA
jgi:stalled ribosome rescue protein Dom34